MALKNFFLGFPMNVNFGSFWEAKVQFLKNLVWLTLSKQCESYGNLNVRGKPKLNSPLKMYELP